MSKPSWKPRISLFLTICAAGFEFTYEDHKKQWLVLKQQQQQSLFSQASWGRLEIKPERNKFKVQAH